MGAVLWPQIFLLNGKINLSAEGFYVSARSDWYLQDGDTKRLKGHVRIMQASGVEMPMYAAKSVGMRFVNYNLPPDGVHRKSKAL